MCLSLSLFKNDSAFGNKKVYCPTTPFQSFQDRSQTIFLHNATTTTTKSSVALYSGLRTTRKATIDKRYYPHWNKTTPQDQVFRLIRSMASAFPASLKPAARSAYRAVLRSARVTFEGEWYNDIYAIEIEIERCIYIMTDYGLWK